MDPTSVGTTNQQTELMASRIAKCPKPFSIESIMSTDSSKSADLDKTIPNGEKLANFEIASNLQFPSNVSMVAAASIYNPWFHFMQQQQQKISENIFEMTQCSVTNQTTGIAKDKVADIFGGNHLSAVDTRIFSTSSNEDRQEPFYFNSNNHELRLNDMISSATNGYYKHLNNYGSLLAQYGDSLEQYRNQTKNNDEIQNDSNDKEKNASLVSEYDLNHRNDDSGGDENLDDELDSDCNSEISLNMSPDGENTIQGTYNNQHENIVTENNY